MTQSLMSERDTDTVYCRQCGSAISTDAKFCPECGSEQNPAESGSKEENFSTPNNASDSTSDSSNAEGETDPDDGPPSEPYKSNMTDEAKFCHECGKRYTSKQTQCFNCHSELADADLSNVDHSDSETKQCPECNTEMPQSYAYCPNCRCHDPDLVDNIDEKQDTSPNTTSKISSLSNFKSIFKVVHIAVILTGLYFIASFLIGWINGAPPDRFLFPGWFLPVIIVDAIVDWQLD